MKTRILLLLLLIFIVPQLLVARLARVWTEQEMFEKADLVVIARAVSTRDTDERSTLPDIEPPNKVIGIETEFETCVVLKGSKDITKFRFHHYKSTEDFTNGPMLVEIPPGKHPTYLLFLIKEADGRYAPASDQIDPAATSVLRVRGATGAMGAEPEPAVAPCEGENRRFAQSWTYQQILHKADLVVIATWVSKRDTDERITLPDIEPPIRVIGMTTEFEISLVLNGPKDVKKLRLHHYKFQSEDDALRAYAPQLVRIPAPVQEKDGSQYPGGGKFLLFLTKEADGRYAPVTGQTDPAVFSVLQLTVAVE